MTTLIKEVYEAFKEAGVSEEKAAAAAGAIERFDEGRFVRIEHDIAEVKADIAELKADVAELKRDVADLKAELRLIKWMLGFTLALVSAVLLKLVLT